MAFFDNGLTRFKAPDGMVYDWAEPHVGTLIHLDGTEEPFEEHLYAKYLQLGRFDDMERYKLVPDPRHRSGDSV